MPGENDLNWKHYETFAENKGIGCTWNAARNPQKWAKKIGASEEVCVALPNKSMNREELTNFCANVDLEPEVRVAAVMAWQGHRI